MNYHDVVILQEKNKEKYCLSVKSYLQILLKKWVI